MDQAAAAKYFARKFALGEAAVSAAESVRITAQRMLGQYLRATPRAQPGPKPEIDTHGASNYKPATLKELNISPKLASASQRLADVPDDAFARVQSGEVKPSVALRDVKRSTLSTRIAALPEGKHRVIYADPPWKYGDERGGIEKADTAAAAQYPTMPTTDICALDIRSLAADDAVLFLWATFPLLEDALAVVRAWGFHYKTSFVWDKQRSNIGNYHDARAELLLICTRGSCPIEIDTRPNQVQSIARGKHSAKPEAFRELIDLMYPTGPRIELFRRGDAPANWKTWGNEATTEAA